MNTKPKESTTPAIYACLSNLIREKAREYGYAIAVHGSMQRDLDLVAVPWIEAARPAEDLIDALTTAVGGYVLPDGTPAARYNAETGKFMDAEVKNPVEKPHGRLAWSIQLGGGAYVDISVMPRVPVKEVNS